MDGVVRQGNRVLENGLQLLSENGDRSEISQLLIADDTALVADSEEKNSPLSMPLVPYHLQITEFSICLKILNSVWVGENCPISGRIPHGQ